MESAEEDVQPATSHTSSACAPPKQCRRSGRLWSPWRARALRGIHSPTRAIRWTIHQARCCFEIGLLNVVPTYGTERSSEVWTDSKGTSCEASASAERWGLRATRGSRLETKFLSKNWGWEARFSGGGPSCAQRQPWHTYGKTSMAKAPLNLLG